MKSFAISRWVCAFAVLLYAASMLSCASGNAQSAGTGHNFSGGGGGSPSGGGSGSGVSAAKDPGPRGGPAGAGGFFPGLGPVEQAYFAETEMIFAEVDSVSGTTPGEDGRGLGPTFNGNSCAQCHAQPAIGGTGPGLASPQNPVPNPQVAMASLDGANNFVPSFITADGPVREARFIQNSDGSPDGGVHDLFTIAGRSDAPGCDLAQPDFDRQLRNHNLIFRIPTPLFGLGLVENTSDAALKANLSADQSSKSKLGISGRLNTSGNDGTVTRFGWKAQNKSLLVFAGEAYNVEQGVANELFSNERSAVSGCLFNTTPEDRTPIISAGTTAEMSADTVSFAAFARLSAPPTPGHMGSSARDGSDTFNSIGCALCHSTSLTTAISPYTGMSNFTYHPFSDFALHHMGESLSDGINQGAAGPDQVRTAPLWGLGQRLFFLHDGRTSDLIEAVQAHSSQGSEAKQVIDNFNSLSPSQQQDLLTFLRAL